MQRCRGINLTNARRCRKQTSNAAGYCSLHMQLPNCAVCFEARVPHTLMCGHTLCRSCTWQVLQCPLCRQSDVPEYVEDFVNNFTRIRERMLITAPNTIVTMEAFTVDVLSEIETYAPQKKKVLELLNQFFFFLVRNEIFIILRRS